MSASRHTDPASAADAPVVTAGTRRHSSALGAAAILILTFAIYWPALRGGFVWDDMILVEKNQLATGDLNLRTSALGRGCVKTEAQEL